MRYAASLSRAGNRILNILMALLILTIALYGAYSLWDTWEIYNRAFASEDLLKYKPAGNAGNTGNTNNPTLQDLMKINPDVRGWLTIDDTHINYPVLQGSYDYEYLNKDVYGNFVLSGSIFLSTGNSGDFSDPYSLVYGHHMDNGAMFGDVAEFVNSSYFEKHQTGTLYLPDQTYHISLFACVEADAYDSQIYDYSSDGKGDIAGLLDYISKIAVQNRNINVTDSDHIIGLSTCADAVTNGRIVLFGRLDAT
ncbi:MAG TPA: class B sortase [Lachnospiraceae bacterium]|nr:class B sortase [Lachnospiraceae bacterium]